MDPRATLRCGSWSSKPWKKAHWRHCAIARAGRKYRARRQRRPRRRKRKRRRRKCRCRRSQTHPRRQIDVKQEQRQEKQRKTAMEGSSSRITTSHSSKATEATLCIIYPAAPVHCWQTKTSTISCMETEIQSQPTHYCPYTLTGCASVFHTHLFCPVLLTCHSASSST